MLAHMATPLRPLTACARSSRIAAECPFNSRITPPFSQQCRATAASRRPRRRGFQTKVTISKFPDFAFTFDIDGVLLRSSTPIPGATRALRYLQDEKIPFILLTNGGGKSEEARTADLSAKLDVELDVRQLVQSHTPFAAMAPGLRGKTVLVVGGEGDACRKVAEGYGFASVVTPGDLLAAYPEIWPFSGPFREGYYSSFARPLPKPIATGTAGESLAEKLKIDAIFVYNDPRDWGLDATVILDTLLSSQGYIGTLSPTNGDTSLPNCGYLQDGQPPLYFSNPDLWWASAYHQSRLGQGGFREAFFGLWRAATQGRAELPPVGAPPEVSAPEDSPSRAIAATPTTPGGVTVFGKPTQAAYEFAEARLRAHRKALFGPTEIIGLNDPLKRVYMVGDNPASDIAGANGYVSPHGSRWTSILVRTGVWRGGEGKEGEAVPPVQKPDVVKEDVWEAVQWAVEAARQKAEV